MERKLTAQEVIDLCKSYMNDKNVEMVEDALELATKAHEGQYRLSGEPFIEHPIQVAGILASSGLDPETVVAGFLHDVVEDSDYTLEDIEEKFSPTIAFLVDGVTKLGKYKFQSKEEALAENHRKMLLATAKDMRIIIIKLADRLHNMRTLSYMSREKQIEKSEEVLDIYAPLADRLGINVIKWELEDLALRYLEPDKYFEIVKLTDAKREEREKFIEETIQQLQEQIAELDIDEVEINGRPKHIYSIYRKMVDQNKDFDDIYDLHGIRVLTNSVADCYAVLGACHTKWKPIPGRFKDYIAMPKANLYQSIHTTVIGPNGRPVEIQIRTHEMHEVAEHGVAAHWAYKAGHLEKVEQTETVDAIQRQMDWLKQLAEYQDDASDATEFVDFVKEDLFQNQVYVFTPKGDVIEVPKGAGPLDFAYAIHTEVGDKTIGAKVNRNIVPLSYELKNGDVVEILTNPNSAGPSRDWLQYVSTSKARNKIKRHFKEADREKHASTGQQMLEKDLKDHHLNFKDLTVRSREQKLLNRFNFNSMTDLLAAIGAGELSTSTIISYLNSLDPGSSSQREGTSNQNEEVLSRVSSKRGQHSQKTVASSNGVVVEGLDNALIRLSRCCNPVPGDKILGYITRGRGISVHRADCPNLLGENELKERTIEVYWEGYDYLEADYETEINIVGFDRGGLISDLLNVVNHTVKNLVSVNGRVDEDANAIVAIKVNVSNTRQLDDLIQRLKNVPDVYEVTRV